MQTFYYSYIYRTNFDIPLPAVVAVLELNYNNVGSDDALEHTVAAGSYNEVEHRGDVDADAEKWELPVVLTFHSEHTRAHSHY